MPFATPNKGSNFFIVEPKYGRMTFLDQIPDYLSNHCINGRTEAVSSQFDIADRYADSLQEPIADAVPVAYFGDHLHAYYNWHLAISNMRQSRPVTLLHFDTHPDMRGTGYRPVPDVYGESVHDRKRYAEDFLSLANFIDAAIYDRMFESAFWILPEWAKGGSGMFAGYWNLTPVSYQAQHLYSERKDFELCFAIRHQEVAGRRGFDTFNAGVCDKFSEGDLVQKSFPFRKSYLDELPDMTDRSVILDIDMDWFCNTGWDTAEAIHSEFDCAAAMPGAIDSLIASLKEKNISPIGVTIATSPDYFPTEATSEGLYLLLSGLIESGVVENPELHSGTPSHSANVAYFARSLYNFIQHRIENPEVKDGEPFVCELNQVDESLGYVHSPVSTRDETKSMPSSWSESCRKIPFACVAGDYFQYIHMARELGLLKLAGALEEFERGGSISESDLLAILSPLLSNVPYQEFQIECRP